MKIVIKTMENIVTVPKTRMVVFSKTIHPLRLACDTYTYAVCCSRPISHELLTIG